MAIETTYMEFSKGNSHKFYEVTSEGCRVVIRYGRIGSTGRTEEHAFASEEEARTFALTKADEKLRKGYQPARLGATETRPIKREVLDERGKFWKLIELSKKGSEGDACVQIDSLRERLLALPEEELRTFDRVLRDLIDESYRADLWGAAYIINGGCSDDGFEYFRGWLILQGEKAFAGALDSPDSLAPRIRRALDEQDAFECEDILNIAYEVYRTKTGRGDFYETQLARKPADLAGNLEAWSDVDSTQENTRRLYPQLCKLFFSD